MRSLTLFLVFLLTVAGLAAPASAGLTETPRFILELEGGPVWQNKNDVQIPNDESGTRFSLVDALGTGPWPAFRFYATWNISDKHGLRVLLAPLNITGPATLDGPVDFAGGSFAAGAPTEATYKFNSWRLSYRYRFHHGERWTWWIGFTGKIRDAKIALEQPTVAAEKTDVGFVPLLNVAFAWRFGDRWSLDLDVDGLAGGPGRAVDGSLKLRYRFDDAWSLAGGYRTVEGGADVESVYNFAWLNYAVVSAAVAF